MRCTSFRSGVRSAFTSGGPTVIMGVKHPSITSAVRMPTLRVGATLARRASALDGDAPATRLLVPERLVQVVRLLRFHELVDDRTDRLDHRDRRLGLEDVPPHVDACRALRDRPVGHLERVELREL